ncbi:hypothetical protein GCM10008932_12360 [Alkalibacterium iburiense]|uniref:Uncharacterized protein n=1 Tax=Alkalibacterium iburiense TaxID=290589 RepID=A0ABN0XD59_9LACT
MDIGANSNVFNVPSQSSTGCGARQRFSPTGGAANGIPLKEVMRGSAAGKPSIKPFSIFVFLNISSFAVEYPGLTLAVIETSYK